VHTKDPCQGERDPLTIPICISWTAATGQEFMKMAAMLAIARHGAILALDHKLVPTQQITIHCIDNEEVMAQVAGQIRDQCEGYVYGVSFLDPKTNPWIAEHPSVAKTQQAVSRQLLECDSCQTRELVHLDDIQSEVFEANRLLSLACKQCAGWTVWKLAEHDQSGWHARSAVTDLASDSVPPSMPRTHCERRHFRVQFRKFKACISCRGFLDEIVSVKDVSRAGFRFMSKKIYRKGTRIEVAIPYAPDAPNIFVSAQIVRFRAIPRTERVEYGVAYVER